MTSGIGHVAYEQQSSSCVVTMALRTAVGCKYSLSVSQDGALEAKDKDTGGARNEPDSEVSARHP